MADRKPKRGMRDEAGVGPNPLQARRLNPMRELPDYQIADGEPDIRGWTVYTATGRELGVVQDLLVDVEMGEVVMIDIDLKRDDRHTLAPIKAAWIDREIKRVVLNTTMFDADESIPALRRHGEPVESAESIERFTDQYERAYGAAGYRDRDITIRSQNQDLLIARSDPVREPETERRPDDVEVRRDIVDEPPTSTPAETERLRQEAGDLTTDARDTLVNPPPTEERR